MKLIKYITVFFGVLFILNGCDPETAEPSTVQKFAPFTFQIADKIEVQELDSTYIIPFTFDDNQIYDVDIEYHVDANSTAVEGEDFDLGAHEASIPTLSKTGKLEFVVHSDVFSESDESVFITISGNHISGYPTKKTIEVVIKNVGGCPPYVHSSFVGDYEVVSDAWQDWGVGTVLTLSDEGANKLGFKYNCADAKPIILTINPDDFSIGGTKQAYCVYGGDEYSADVTEATSQVNTCDKVLTLTMFHTDPANNGGSYAIVLKKK